MGPLGKRRGGARASVVCVAALLVLVAAPAAAMAHPGDREELPNYQARVLAIEPETAGLTARAVDAGTRIQLTNRTDRDVLVLGYEGEPFLQVGPDGVFENRRSPTAQQGLRDGVVPLRQSPGDASAPPEWVEVDGGRTVTWSDHRAHWTGIGVPPWVAAAPDQAHVAIARWTLDLRMAGEPITVVGELLWVPGPSQLPWVLVGALALGAGVLAARGPRWRGALSGLMLTVVGVEVLALLATGEGGTRPPLETLAGYPVTLAGIGLGLVAARGLKRPRDAVRGLVLVGVAGTFVLVTHTGELQTLRQFELVSPLPPMLARTLIALELGLSAGIVLGALLRLRTLTAVRDLSASVPVRVGVPVPMAVEGSRAGGVGDSAADTGAERPRATTGTTVAPP